jgi:hypothetical protein
MQLNHCTHGPTIIGQHVVWLHLENWMFADMKCFPFVCVYGGVGGGSHP